MTLIVLFGSIDRHTPVFIEETLSGVLDVRIYPKIMVNQKTYEARHPINLRLEDPREITISQFQDRLIDPIKQSIASIGL